MAVDEPWGWTEELWRRQTAKPKPGMSAEGLRRRGYRERPVRRGPGCRGLSRRGGTQRPAGGFPRENRRSQRRAGHHLWTTMGEAQPPAAAAPPWARSRVAEVARELGALRDILRTARGLVPFPLSHPTGAGDAGPELRLGALSMPSLSALRPQPAWARVWVRHSDPPRFPGPGLCPGTWLSL